MVEKAVVTPILKPEEWRSRQIGNLKAVGETNFRVGIAAPRADPIERGIATEEKYAAEIKKAIDEKRRQKALKATNIDEWYSYSVAIGAPRLVEGVAKREVEVKQFIDTFQPMLLAHTEEIRKMPEVTDAEREQRMLTNVRGLKGLKGAWRR